MMFTQEVHICGGVPLPRPPKDVLYVNLSKQVLITIFAREAKIVTLFSLGS